MPDTHVSPSLASLTVVAVLLPAPATAATTNEGTAYRLDDGAAAYREIHLLHESGGHPARLVLYRRMDGSTFARKTDVERTGAVTPDFDFTDGRTGYREGMRTTARGREVLLAGIGLGCGKKDDARHDRECRHRCRIR